MKVASVVSIALLQVAAHAHQLQEPNHAHQRRNAAMLSQSCSANGQHHLLGQNTCLLNPEVVEGPYVYPTAPIRYDMREDTEGIPFKFDIRVVNSATCEPFDNVAVEMWHADNLGLYSHFIEQSMGNPGAPADDTTFLRAVQFTNELGVASFFTTFPGHYLDRTWHMHVRVHFGVEVAEDNSGYTGGFVAHVGQIYCADEVSVPLSQVPPYSENETPTTALPLDSFFNAQNGTYGLIYVEEMCEGQGLENGIVGGVTVAVLEQEAEPWTPPPGFIFPGYILPTEPGAEPTEIRNTLPPGYTSPLFGNGPTYDNDEYCSQFGA